MDNMWVISKKTTKEITHFLSNSKRQ